MARFPLRIQLLIATLVIICTLTGVILFVVRITVRNQVRQQVRESVSASLLAFKSVQEAREAQLTSSAAMLAQLPTLKALMTTGDAATIQDASGTFWRLAGSDLLALADVNGEVMALHAKSVGFKSQDLKGDFTRSREAGEEAAWWYSGERLYWVFLKPISAGAGSEEKALGEVAIGYEVDTSVARQLALVADSRIALATGNHVIASTLLSDEVSDLQEHLRREGLSPESAPIQLDLAGEPYEAASVLVHPGPGAPVQCYVLLPLQNRLNFVSRLDSTIIALAIFAVAFGSILLTFVSRTITRPLENLVAGVRALAVGDFNYSISNRGSSEVVELGQAFSKMRGELMASQARLLETERVAAVGRAAGSISHDLRHYLAAVVANAEFLHEAESLHLDRDEIYDEIRVAAEQMTELIDSLRELAREHRTVNALPSSIDQAIRRAMEAVLTRPELRNREISVRAKGDLTGFFDPKKIERVFLNLILNACQATSERTGKIEIDVDSHEERFDVRVSDNGPGIPPAIRDMLFDAFVSSGKANGTGLGLAIVSKIIQDHNGTVAVESSSEEGTVFLIRFPRFQHSERRAGEVDSSHVELRSSSEAT